MVAPIRRFSPTRHTKPGIYRRYADIYWWRRRTANLPTAVFMVPVADSATGSEQLGVAASGTVADAATGSEQVGLTAVPDPVADSATGAEQLDLAGSATVTDSATGSEQLSLTAIEFTTWSDSATGSEGTPTVFDAHFVLADDQATGTETIAYGSTTTVTGDTGTGTEDVAVARASTAADSATGTQSLTLQYNWARTDSATVSQALSYVSTTTATDSATVAEQIAILQRSTATDSAAGSETVDGAFFPAAVDHATGTTTIAAILRSSSVADTATGIETVKILRFSSFVDSAAGTNLPIGAGPYLTDMARVSEFVYVVDIPLTRLLPLALGVVYDLVVVARVPQAQGDPLLFEIDPIEWKTITLVNALNEPQDLTATCQLSSLTTPVIERLTNPDTLPCEMRLYRNGKVVFAGPLLGWQTSAETLTIKAQGLLTYLKMMVIVYDLNYASIDQAVIVRAFVDQWQALPYGDFGIDTTALTTVGVGRTVSYLAGELHNVYQRVLDLGKLIFGFDVEVDPASRKLQIWSPTKGADRSLGDDAIVFDERNVTSSDTMCSVAPGDLATVAITSSKPASGSTLLYSQQYNTALLAKYGRTAITATATDIATQSGVDWLGQGLLAPRGQALYVPGPKVRVTPDADLPDYDVGDTVSYEFGGVLGISGSFRIRKRTVNVGSNGREAVDLELA